MNSKPVTDCLNSCSNSSLSAGQWNTSPPWRYWLARSTFMYGQIKEIWFSQKNKLRSNDFNASKGWLNVHFWVYCLFNWASGELWWSKCSLGWAVFVSHDVSLTAVIALWHTNEWNSHENVTFVVTPEDCNDSLQDEACLPKHFINEACLLANILII